MRDLDYPTGTSSRLPSRDPCHQGAGIPLLPDVRNAPRWSGTALGERIQAVNDLGKNHVNRACPTSMSYSDARSVLDESDEVRQ